MKMQDESLAKTYILTHGVRFSVAAIQHARMVGAKLQNVVYNLPGADVDERYSTHSSQPISEKLDRPQELFLIGEDGYKVCVSAVAPVPARNAAIVEIINDRLVLETPAHPNIGKGLAGIEFVPQPAYYERSTTSGRPVRRWVSACGYDEMNVWPWHDCAIGRVCSFCGINSVQRKAGLDVDFIHALELRRNAAPGHAWAEVREAFLMELTEAVTLAIDDDCYQEEVHLIIISGNLADDQLDLQARIYADIAKAITIRHSGRFAEGAVAVTAPPRDLRLLRLMREGGVEIGVFNLEAFTPKAFSMHCPGKDRIGRDHYLSTLGEGVNVFGWGRAWCNFVLGLESVQDLLSGCEHLASQGITPGANVLHRDHGAAVEVDPPHFEAVIDFYKRLAGIYRRYDLRPYYCQLALRTSLANEAFAGRLG